MTDAARAHAIAVAQAICRDAQERDRAGARIWDKEIKPQTRIPELAALFNAAAELYGPFPAPAPGTDAPPRKLIKTAGKYHQHDRAVLDSFAEDMRPADQVSPEEAAQHRAALDLLLHRRDAEKALKEQVERDSGDAADEKFARQKRDRELLLSQSHELAQRLEAAGVQAYRSDKVKTWVFYVCSETWEQNPNFRRLCFLPHVAAQVRASKLAALEFFISRNLYCRFWTFTSGPRVGLDKLRERIQWLHAKLNALNQYLRRKYRIELVFRSTELGTIEFDHDGNKIAEEKAGKIEFDENGSPLFHPHAHCVMRHLYGKLDHDKWTQAFKDVWAFWKDDQGNQLNWDGGRKGESGVIRKPSECCKYVTKPGDMLKLSGAHLAATEAALRGLHLVQPLGALKKEIARRKQWPNPKKLVRVPTGDGKTVWAEKPDWNKWPEQPDDPSPEAGRNKSYSREENLRKAHAMARETPRAAKFAPGKDPGPFKREKNWTKVFARLAPAIGPRMVKEPRVIVGGNVFDLDTVRRHPLVARLWAQAIQNYERGRRAEEFCAQLEVSGISVHTGTPIANAAAAEPEPECWENAAPVEIGAHFAP